jgi:hypothetical protein
MASTPESIAFERGIRPVLQIVFPDKLDAILQLQPSAELQSRIEELASKSTEGALDEAERAAYEGYVRANKFVVILQRHARHMTGRS